MRGNKNIAKKIFCVLMSFLPISLYLSSTAFAVNKVEQHQQSKRALQEKKKKLAEEYKSKQNDVSEEKKKKDSLNSQIDISMQQIDESNAYIDDLEEEIKKLDKQIEEINNEMNHKIELLRSSLASIHVAGDISTLDIILGAKDFEDFLDKVDIVRNVSKTIGKLIDDLRRDLNVVKEKKKQQEEAKANKEKEKQEIEKTRLELQGLIEQSEKLIGELQDSADDVQRKIDQNSAEIKAIDAEVQKYYEEQRRLEEERRRQAEKANTTYVPPAPAAKGSWVWPAGSYHLITSGFYDCASRRSMHGGIDIAGVVDKKGIYGAPIYAANDGTVITANTDCVGGGYGNYVVIDHENGISTWYAHLSSVSVSAGQKVLAGQVIGYAGSTGNSTGPHLHFEYRVNNVRTDPHAILDY